jgi:hypothetical protein
MQSHKLTGPQGILESMRITARAVQFDWGQGDGLGGTGCRRRLPGYLFMMVGRGWSFCRVDDAF